MRIDINSDLGEGFGPWKMGDDDAMLDIVTTANIACGFHAGDPETMRRTIATARDKSVGVGAHPGYADLIGFGRRRLPGTSEREVENLVAYQVGAFQAMCALAGHTMTHVKTHGALGNLCAEEEGLASALARAVKAVDPTIPIMVFPGTASERAADRLGLRLVREIYADRAYEDSFHLVDRSKPGAVIHDPDQALERAKRMVGEGRIESVSGKILETPIDSICVHGDNPTAVEMARSLRRGFEEAGWTVAALASREAR